MSETHRMQPRLDYAKFAPKVIEAMYAVERYVRTSGLEPPLLELVKLRASQINGCAYCVDMHTKDARANGETEQRLYAVAVQLIDLTTALIAIKGWNRLAGSFRALAGTYQPAAHHEAARER